ncbi:uncharacterized protein V6R79_004233 [Siganus canaliculatus]
MDRLDFHVNEELLQFFHCNKTEISCLENPHTFLSQLRDHNLVPEDKYKKINRMRSKEQMKKALYDLLDWLERERPQHIKLFWTAVFKETILNRYPVLRTLRNSLMDGSFDFITQLPETVEKEKRGVEKQKRHDDDDDESEEEEKETKSVKRKRKLRSKSMCDDDDERNAGPWTPVIQTQKKSKICYSPLEKRERGHRKAASYTRQCKKRLKFTYDSASTEEEEEEEEEVSETDTEDEDSSATHVSDEEDGSGEREQVFKVTCGAVAATLHQKRFASGSQGKSIRTETCWMTPHEFAMEALGQRDVSWRKDIEWEGQPLGKLTQDGILVIHWLGCDCHLCKEDSKELENQKNDDECCICKREGDLVMCDQCPRSFHQKCHLPHVDDSTLGDDSPWLCTFCVFRSNQQYLDEQTMEAAMSRQISQHMLECQYLFLHLCRADADQTFAEDPNLYLSDYSTVVKTPMWLRKIADKLQEQRYQTVGEFVSDVDLIFTNCASYNEDDAKFLAYGNGLKELFNEEFKNVFNIQ